MRSRSPSVASQRSPSFSRITFILPRMTKKISSTSVWMCIGPMWPAGISIVENVKWPAGTTLMSDFTPVPPVPT